MKSGDRQFETHIILSVHREDRVPLSKLRKLSQDSQIDEIYRGHICDLTLSVQSLSVNNCQQLPSTYLSALPDTPASSEEDTANVHTVPT